MAAPPSVETPRRAKRKRGAAVAAPRLGKTVDRPINPGDSGAPPGPRASLYPDSAADLRLHASADGTRPVEREPDALCGPSQPAFCRSRTAASHADCAV